LERLWKEGQQYVRCSFLLLPPRPHPSPLPMSFDAQSDTQSRHLRWRICIVRIATFVLAFGMERWWREDHKTQHHNNELGTPATRIVMTNPLQVFPSRSRAKDPWTEECNHRHLRGIYLYTSHLHGVVMPNGHNPWDIQKRVHSTTPLLNPDSLKQPPFLLNKGKVSWNCICGGR